ncbi:DUF1343 domain-containing protein [Bacillus licheniformis]|nr:DUF1343 domain-containing protein [Bacillus licheniformis]
MPGVRFRAASFNPTFSKHQNKLCHGVELYVTNRSAFKPVNTGIAIIKPSMTSTRTTLSSSLQAISTV